MRNKGRYVPYTVLPLNSLKACFFLFQAKTDAATSNADHDDSPVIISDTTYSAVPPNQELSSMELKERRGRMSISLDVLMHAMFSATDESSEANKTFTCKLSKMMRKKKEYV